MSTTTTPSLPAAAVPGRSIAAWWQAAPFTLVFVLFFLVPLALIVMVSFWDFNEYELLPGFTFTAAEVVGRRCLNQTPPVQGRVTEVSSVLPEWAVSGE